MIKPSPTPDGPWLDALRGRPQSVPAPDSDEALAARSGELIRAHFEAQLREVRSAPDPELTRARVLAAASAGPRAPVRRPRALAIPAGVGLAAGIVGTLLLHPQAREFSDVLNSQELVSNAEIQPLSTGSTRRFVVRSRDVPATAAQLAALLTRARAPFRVTPQPDGALQFDVQPLSHVPTALSQAAGSLKISFPPDTAIRVYVEVP